MSENPTYDIEVSREAAAGVTKLRTAESSYTEARGRENRAEDNAKRLQQIMNKGFLSKILARSERKNLQAELAGQAHITKDQMDPFNVHDTDRIKVRTLGQTPSATHGVQMARAKRDGARHYEANAGQYYNNAVVEANADFTNKGRVEQIITPAVLQDQADKALEQTIVQPQEAARLVRPPQAS